MSREWCKGTGIPGHPQEGGHFVGIEWRSVAWLRNGLVYKSRCFYCAQTRRDYQKRQDRDKVKAASTKYAHARRLAPRWNVTVREAFRRLGEYGWNVPPIADMFRAARLGGVCSECGHDYDLGDHEITLDISEPNELPVIENTSVMCRTCNTAKGDMTLAQWRQRKAYIRAVLAGDCATQLALLLE